jgi:hypothetical protein
VEEPFPSAFECTLINDVREAEIHTEEPLLPEPSAFEAAVSM